MCPTCASCAAELAPGPGGRKGAKCPTCGSLERHRFQALVLGVLADSAAGGVVLDVAPVRMLVPLLRDLPSRGYVSLDFDPAGSGRPVSVQGSLTELPLASGSVGLMMCSHVLEHIPDDAAAMREIARCLTDEGRAMVLVPWRAGPTEEDLEADADERLRKFGQADHVRYYGDDFEARLVSAGLDVARFTPRQVLPAALISALGIKADEPMWLCARAGRLGFDPAELTRCALDSAGRIVALAAERAAGERLEQAAALARASERVKRLRRKLRRREGRPGPRSVRARLAARVRS